ncbi:hypothetical protein C0J50_10174, partial [Silurus asotus]
FTLALILLENILDDNFICPCRNNLNYICFFLCTFVPAIGCFISTLFFVDVSPEFNNKMEKTPRRFLYAFLTALTWLSIILIDGRYCACAYSDWEGLYTTYDTFGKWCKPTGNNISEVTCQKRTLDLICISQV